ncbi:hypothetical protein ElyMa_006578900 [Elysia marginata]|uniref:WH2 domain-containing protein n=1 Tax=Elysia marginata TaxID=1093978 RepID=A0AAV4IDP4_9GAST|nr:hypothetical protein ElyMa_006578900 [Elysia marginata]
MGQEAKDFESYIPCGSRSRRVQPQVEYTPPDLSKYAGAKFRVASHKENKKATLPLMIINQYVKKAKPGKGGGDGPPIQASAKTPPPPPPPSSAPAGAKPPVKVVKISKEEYAKLLAQNKLQVLDANNPAGKVIKLQPGMQLKAMTSPASAATPAAAATKSPSLSSAAPPVAVGGSPASLASKHPTQSSRPPQAITPVSLGRKRAADGIAEGSLAKKVTKGVDIKDRLRLINERLGHKLKKGSARGDDGAIITREEAVYADSKVVNGQTFLNVSTAKGGSGSFDLGIASVDYLSPALAHSKNLPDSTLAAMGQLESGKLINEGEKDLSGTSGIVRDSSDKSLTPSSSVKKVRFIDQVEDSDSEGTGKTGSSEQSPTKASTSPAKSFSGEPQISIYEKWKRRALRANPVLFSKRQVLQEPQSQEESDNSDRKRKHEALESAQHHISDPERGRDTEEVAPEDDDDDDESEDDEPMMKYSKKGGVWLEEKTKGSKSQHQDCFNKVVCEDGQGSSEQLTDNRLGDTSATTSDPQLPTSPLRENGQCEVSSPVAETAPADKDGKFHRDSFNQALHLQQKTDPAIVSSDHPLSSLQNSQHEQSTSSLSISPSEVHTSPPSREKATNNQHLQPSSSSSSSPPPPPLSSSDLSPAAASSSKTIPHPPEPSSSTSFSSPSSSSSLAAATAAQKKAFRLSGLTTQLALAMAQKRQQKSGESASNSDGEEDAESPPLLLPVGQEEPGRGGSREPSPGDDDMPVLVPDQLPPSLVEPGQDNIFQRMMSPEKYKS